MLPFSRAQLVTPRAQEKRYVRCRVVMDIIVGLLQYAIEAKERQTDLHDIHLVLLH